MANPNVTNIVTEVKEATILEWQWRWVEETLVAGWTRRVLSSVCNWIWRPSGAPVTYQLAQVLSGYLAFGEYLHRFGLLDSSECPHCGAAVDDVCHTVFVCLFWDERRTGVTAAIFLLPKTSKNFCAVEPFRPTVAGERSSIWCRA